MKSEVLASFKADYQRLNATERDLFRKALPAFVAACDRYAVDPSGGWPAALRVKSVANAPGVFEMSWSFSGPDGRATFEGTTIDGELAARWRRIRGHVIFREP